jgi:CHAT domain-containing protein
VVPDGPLHKLPLEAVVVHGGNRPRYLLDELPPIVYAPSVDMLVHLADRPALGPKAPLSLVTVSDPAYRAPRPGATQMPLPELLELARGLPLLPGTAEESRALARFFPPDQVTSLARGRATKPAVVAAMPGKRFVHLAAHCFADDRFGNLFGAVALTPIPPGKETTGDDGFLGLSEICGLPLQDCELAILSACVTHVGPQRPLEAGVTVANGFLTAGARRVVASHWDVDDRATAALMEAFVAEVAEAAGRGDKLPCARALRNARLKVRGHADWSTPFYWAPFVLLGPPE